MNRSESIADLSAALAKAQAEIKGASKDSTNPFFKSKYADLASVWDACREPLSANGLTVMQFPSLSPERIPVTHWRENKDGISEPVETQDLAVSVETVLSHESGEWVSETLTLPVGKSDAQGIGSAITYGRRYGLASVVGVAPEDDDGNAAAQSGAQRQPAKHSDNGSSKPALITKTEWADIQRRLSGDGQASLLRHFKLERGGQLRVDQLADVGVVIDANPSWHYRPEAKRMTPGQQDEMDELAKRLGLESVEQVKAEIFTVLNKPVEPLALSQEQAEQVLSAMRGKALEASKT